MTYPFDSEQPIPRPGAIDPLSQLLYNQTVSDQATSWSRSGKAPTWNQAGFFTRVLVVGLFLFAALFWMAFIFM